jgi:glucose/mannose transport system permease protein
LLAAPGPHGRSLNRLHPRGPGAGGLAKDSTMSQTTAFRSPWLPKLVVAPSFLIAFAFIYGLIAWNGWLSVSASRLLPNYRFVGFEQYARLFESERFQVAAINMGIFGSLFIAGSMALGLLLAILLDQKIRAEGVLRTIYLYPMAISFIVTGTAWKWMLNPGLGLEHLMQQWGFQNFQFD